MKHTDFLKALKTLKSQLLTSKNKKTIFFFQKEKTNNKDYCTCKDAKGEYKYLYSSQKEMEYLLASKNLTLYAYPCPYEKGWHLSKV